MTLLPLACALVTDAFHEARVDADGDGAVSEPYGGPDCNDADAEVHPGVLDACDGIDNDCDGGVDEEAEFSTWYLDADGDGFGDAATSDEFCSPPDGRVEEGSDCDDAAVGVFPGADEYCNGADDDCDGEVDVGALDAGTWYTDADGDGYGKDGTDIVACDQPTGSAAGGGDCDDADIAVNPGVAEECTDPVDRNCDGTVGAVDGDGDGFFACEECDDTNAAVSPAGTEACNEVDDDCDGSIDEDASDASNWHADADGDLFGDPAGFVASCDPVPGTVENADDCDDTDAEVHPDAAEVCNDVDDDCSGDADSDAEDAPVWHMDADGDAFGAPGVVLVACDQPEGWVSDGSDCDDADANANPGEVEACDAGDVDEDCDGLSDDADEAPAGTVSWFEDSDADGFGDPASSTVDLCEAPIGFVSTSTDCDDADAAVSPSGLEVCDETDTDEDCDGAADDDDGDAAGQRHWYEDADGDGFGAADGAAVNRCDSPVGLVATNDDCDDGDASISPSATETCGDGLDNDCDGGPGDCGPSSQSLSLADAQFSGAAAGDQAGYDLAGVGDVNADGFADVLVGSHYDNGGGSAAGAAHLVLGSLLPTSLGLAAADAKYLGEDVNDIAGEAVAGAGDVDGDGIVDMVIGAPGSDAGGSSTGAVYLLLGRASPTSSDLSAADARYVGVEHDERVGYGVTGAGDVDGDGFDDVAMGAPGNDGDAGAVYVFLGSPAPPSAATSSADAVFTGEAGTDRAGHAIAGGSDVNGDGLRDLLVGAAFSDTAGKDAGAAYLILGASSLVSASLTAADSCFTGEVAGDRAGASVAGGSDIDADGYSEILVGAPNSGVAGSLAGAAYVVLGAASPPSGSLAAVAFQLAGIDTNDQAGIDVAGVGDVDLDGFDDLLVGAYGIGGTDGGAHFVRGSASFASINLSDAESTFSSDGVGDLAGRAVAGAGDVDDDGYRDLLIGADRNEDAGYDAGAAFLILGGGL